MIFHYQVDVDRVPIEDREPTKFVRVLAAQLDEEDWSFSGRREGSRGTITAAILRSGSCSQVRCILTPHMNHEGGVHSGLNSHQLRNRFFRHSYIPRV